jgi:hypothetical protein
MMRMPVRKELGCDCLPDYRVSSQKTAIFIVTAMRISGLTRQEEFETSERRCE